MSAQTEISPQIVNLAPQRENQLRTKSLLQRAIYRVRHDKLTLFAIAVIVLVAFLAVFAPPISAKVLQVQYDKINLKNNYKPPMTLTIPKVTVYSSEVVTLNGATDDEVVGLFNFPSQWDHYHLLGTDEMGRDHLARLLYGGRVSLTIGFSAAIISLIIGVSVGVVSGFYGGVVDDLVIWFITTLNSIPALFLLLMISALFKPSPAGLIFVLAILGWTGTTRIMRGETLSLKEREFTVAARAIGASNFRIMFIHIVPNVLSLLIIDLATSIGALMLAEAGLSFLGFGISPETPTWGNMLSGGLDLIKRAPHLMIAPGLLISTIVLCLYLTGDGLRDAFDPRIVD